MPITAEKQNRPGYSLYKIPQVFQSFGSVERIEHNNGDLLIILPTCDVSVGYLHRDRWSRVSQMGNARSVRLIEALDNGDTPHLVAKSPERNFTAEQKRLDKGEVWWGGKKSGERFVSLKGNPIVESQSIWEAAILLELRRAGFKAEVPQALVVGRDGQLEVITREVETSYAIKDAKGPTYSELLKDIRRKTSLVPLDSSTYNSLSDREGRVNIIDVNRWLWLPYTDRFKRELVEEVRSAVNQTQSLVA